LWHLGFKSNFSRLWNLFYTLMHMRRIDKFMFMPFFPNR